jgi:hypothetical protein
MTDDQDNGSSVSNLSDRSESYPLPLIADSTTVSEPDMSLLNTITSSTSISCLPLVGTYSKDIFGAEPVPESMQAEL